MDKMIAVVTGGMGGIGSAICQRLASQYQVIACYFKNGHHDDAISWQTAQQQAGFNIGIAYADLTKFTDCQQLANVIIEKYGPVGVLINNAGITVDSCFKNMSSQQWQQVIDANLTSVFNVTRHFLPAMIEQQYGRIINISSVNGRKGRFGQCNYAATKAALFGLTKSLALEVARKKITVNTISPGYIESPMLDQIKPDILAAIINDIPLGRLGKPEEVANMVAFLAASESSFITGANFDINGGQYM